MNNWITTTIAAVVIAISTPAQAANSGFKSTEEFDKLRKEIDIMSNIINATAEEVYSKELRMRSGDSHYLAGQGIIFELKTRGSRHFRKVFHYIDDNMPVPPMPPEDLLEDLDLTSLDIEVNGQNVGKIAEEAIKSSVHAYESAVQGFYVRNEKERELRDEIRDLDSDIRDLERDKRDLEFERRHATHEKKSSLEKELNKVDKKIAKIREKRKEIDKHRAKLIESMKEKKQTLLQEYKSTQKQLFSAAEQMISETLCNYGNGLRSLPKDENVTFVLKDVSKDRHGDKQDKIYIFKNSDIRECVRGKIDANELVSKGTHYFF
ncbi:coiled-coil domain-containing protein [Flocculibacter collagenilyticus]|uniref:coiled-coil domain-containing protein n=1 Tax=Flocculibacter collagenilyticus TaxID=2744479 RepID=UPI0018F2FB22|nr:hypothetical protein [Flocculibacter collagenilyticus]